MIIGILHQYSLETSGSGVYAMRLVEALLERGHRVVIVCRDPDAHALPFVDEVWHHGDQGPRLAYRVGPDPKCIVHALMGGLPGVAYPRTDVPDGVIFAAMDAGQRADWMGYQVEQITDIVRMHGVQVMHANHEVPMAEVARRVEGQTGVPYIVVAHGSTIEYVHQPAPAWRPATRSGLRGARQVVALNTEGRERLLAVDPALAASIEISPVGVDTTRFVPAPRTGTSAVEDGRIAYVGRLSWEKGLHLLLTALPSVAATHPSVRLDVIGDGGDEESLVELTQLLDSGDHTAVVRLLDEAHRAGAGDWVDEAAEEIRAQDPRQWAELCRRARVAARVTFAGHLDSAGVATRLSEADLLVVPSLVREAFPLVVLEALSCGVPPLGSRSGGLEAVLDDVAPHLGAIGTKLHLGASHRPTISAVASGVSDALATLSLPGQRGRARADCRRLATERYDWCGVAARLEMTYERASGMASPSLVAIA
jgi:glycosyltransferase involved in cell wall biosynthesis